MDIPPQAMRPPSSYARGKSEPERTAQPRPQPEGVPTAGSAGPDKTGTPTAQGRRHRPGRRRITSYDDGSCCASGASCVPLFDDPCLGDDWPCALLDDSLDIAKPDPVAIPAWKASDLTVLL